MPTVLTISLPYFPESSGLSIDPSTGRQVLNLQRDVLHSRFVGDLLQARMESARGYERAMTAFLARRPQKLKAGGHYPCRDP